MIDLRLLGAVRLTASRGRVPDTVLTQPKRLGLLAYLALAGRDGWVARDTLLALFWPESDEARARDALRQALSFLRREVGRDVVVSRGRSWLGLAPDRVTCDVWDFHDHLAAGRPREALALYRGELLQGLELRGLLDFDAWVIGRRLELSREAMAAAWELAEAAREDGDREEAIRLARRARSLDPADEAGVRRLMGIQLWAGDRAGALTTYDRFESWLARELDAVPSVLTRELAARARGPAVPDPDHASPDHPGPDGAGPDHPGRGPGHRTDPLAARAGEWRRVASYRPGRRWVVAALALAAVVAGFIGVRTSPLTGGTSAGGGTGAPDAAGAASAAAAAGALVVMPFEVRDGEGGLAPLRHGMAQLLAAVFTGDLGPRAIEVPDTLDVEPDADGAPLLVARRLGARWVVDGRVMRAGSQVSLHGSLRDAAGERPARSASLSGPADSVYALAEELGLRLLALHMGASEDEARRLGRTTPPALRDYLRGRQAYRESRYEDADAYFRQALRHDSLFPQAAAGLVEASLSAPWLRGHVADLALPLAVRLRDRLGPADRAIVTAVAGPRYPGRSTQAEYYRAWEEAVRLAPDRPAVWFQWGDANYHMGPFIGMPGAMERASAAFHRTLALDSAFVPPLGHLIEMAVMEGDTTRARQVLELLLRTSPDPGSADYLRWRIAMARGDSAGLRELRSRFHEMDVADLGAILRVAQFTGEGLDDAERIAALDLSRWSAPAERRTMLFRLHTLALNRGRAHQAPAFAEAMQGIEPEGFNSLQLIVRDALVAGGDTATARDAAARLAARFETPVPDGAEPPADRLGNACALAAWRLHQGDVDAARPPMDWVQRVARREADAFGHAAACAAVLDAMLARAADRPLEPHIDRLWDLVAEGAQPPGLGSELLRVTLARLLEACGELERALHVTRLRMATPYMLATQLRDEGRLATLMGDAATARRAYRHYLRLRADPDPFLRPEVEAVRAALESLDARTDARTGARTDGAPISGSG